MAINSINTNIAAYYAQANISIASRLAAASVSRLSSGNRIVLAADDVAALATGTSLATTVSALRTALTNAAQGTSLLQVADGALAQITSILQRQKAIAQQAGSGSLTDSDRAFLNQEFQALTDEIDRISSSTNFNGVNLIDGGLSGSTAITTDTSDGTSTANASNTILTFATAVPAEGDTVTIAGVTVTFTTAAPGTSGAVGKVSVGSSVANTAANLAAFLNETGDPHFANLHFEASGATVLVNYTGGTLNGTVSITVSADPTTAANLTSANATIAPQSAAGGLGVERVTYSGEITGSLLVNAGTTAQTAGQALNVTDVEDNAAFIGALGTGSIGSIEGTYSTTDTAVFSLQVGDITYSTVATDITSAGAVVSLTFIGKDQYGATKGGQFVLNLNGSAITASSITSQATLDPIVTQLNQALSDISFQQNRDIYSFTTSNIVELGGIEVANLTGLTVDFNSDDFSNAKISSVSITAPTSGGTDAVIEVVINGEIYRSISGIGNQIEQSKLLALQNVNDPSKVVTIVTGITEISGSSTTVLDLATQEKADAVAAALEEAFGLDETDAGLSFQIGTAASDVLGVTIGDSGSSALFGGVTLDVLTQENAATASAAVSEAIESVTSIRASVGALESRFNFASANLQSAVQNQDAARSELLDTDIATEATAYATQQVKLQAGISVLAQANQQLQSLLKLIG